MNLPHDIQDMAQYVGISTDSPPDSWKFPINAILKIMEALHIFHRGTMKAISRGPTYGVTTLGGIYQRVNTLGSRLSNACLRRVSLVDAFSLCWHYVDYFGSGLQSHEVAIANTVQNEASRKVASPSVV